MSENRMDNGNGYRWPTDANYVYKVEQRAIKHREIIHRNNTTSCRSPTRNLDPCWIKTELQRKRQLEFFKRRHVDCSSLLLSPVPRRRNLKETLQATGQMTQSPTSIRITSPNVELLDDDVNFAEETVSRSSMKMDNLLKSNRWKEQVHNFIQLRVKMKKEKVQCKDNTLLSDSQRSSQTASIQTESGFITVKKADIHQLSDYLVEALQREDALKKKLSGLQKSSSLLLRTTELLWKTRCDEDVLKSKIKALEAQLQVCIKNVPQEGVKKVMLKMEKQRGEYERKALKAIQRAENDKAEAQSKMEYLQGAHQTAHFESEHWQRLCEELKESSGQLKKKKEEQRDQILQLQGDLECSMDKEEMLRKQNESMEQERLELHSCISELEVENQQLREYLQEFTDINHEWWNTSTQIDDKTSVLDQLLRTDDSTARQLRNTEAKLRKKEREYTELQADLEVLEQECHGYQSRLRQCREELNIQTLRQTKHTRGCCSRWLSACIFLLMLMVMLMVLGTLWIYHPVTKQQLCLFYSEVEKFVKTYVKRMAPVAPPVCFRPV